MLEVQGLETAYGESQVLFGIDLEIRAGEVITLMGRNGMGKTTIVRSIMGLTPPWCRSRQRSALTTAASNTAWAIRSLPVPAALPGKQRFIFCASTG